MNILKYQFFRYLLVLIVGVFLGVCSYNKVFNYKKNILNRNPKIANESREGKGKFTNPLLECKQEELYFSELRPFKAKIEKLVTEIQGHKGVDTVAVYFRDLNNGPWFGIEEQSEFAPASLLKLPLAIAYYKLSENNKDILSRQLTYTSDDENQIMVQTIVPKETLQNGIAYSVEDLIFRMLAYSDNKSYGLLLSNIELSDLSEIYKDFGFNINDLDKTDEIVNVQNYSSFF